MKTMQIIMGCIFPLLLFTSCENWFDVSPKSELKGDDLFKEASGARDALIGCYGLMAGEELYGAQLTMTYVDVLGQYYASANVAQNAFQNAFTYKYSEPTEDARKDAIWKRTYNVVANINSLLQRIEGKSKMFPTGEFELIKGEALGLRAYLHLDLLRLFGASPAMKEGLVQPAIPYVDRYTKELFPLLTVEEILERILIDLTESRKLLSEVDPFGPKSSNYDLDNLSGIWKGREFRMNYYAATALMARTLLYRNGDSDRSKAYECALEVINSMLFPLITGEQISGNDQNGFVQENVFALEKRGLKENVIDNYFYTSNQSSTYLAMNKSTITRVFPVTLDIDYRMRWWIEQSGNIYLLAKYNHAERIPLLKVSEMYLIAAESASQLIDGEYYFNKLLYHRGLPEEKLEAKKLQSRILAEYAKEFIGEGQLFFAYKRMGNGLRPIFNTSLSNAELVYKLPLPTQNTHFTH